MLNFIKLYSDCNWLTESELNIYYKVTDELDFEVD